MSIPAFFAPEQLLHDPQQFMRLGRIHKPADLPARADALKAALLACGASVQEPADAGLAAIEAVHSPHYVAYLRTAYERWQALANANANAGVQPGPEVLPNLWPYYSAEHGRVRPPCPSTSLVAQTGYYLGDLSCPLGAQSWQAILRSAHTAIAAAQAVCDGQALAYALCRPSGHHAHYDRASGFCYLNNNAIAAQMLAQRFGRVAILDVDAHHGDGTQNIFYERSDVLTVSTHAQTNDYFPFFTGYEHERGFGQGQGCNLNLPLAHGSGNAEFAIALDKAIAAIEAFKPQALILAMGFDTYKDDPMSVLKFDHAAYTLVGKRLASLGLPLVVVQEGGYMVSALELGLTALMNGLLMH